MGRLGFPKIEAAPGISPMEMRNLAIALVCVFIMAGIIKLVRFLRLKRKGVVCPAVISNYKCSDPGYSALFQRHTRDYQRYKISVMYNNKKYDSELSFNIKAGKEPVNRTGLKLDVIYNPKTGTSVPYKKTLNDVLASFIAAALCALPIIYIQLVML